MATYKVLQDIEAEDKLVGPLTLWQFIYALVAGLCIYLSAIAVMRNMSIFLVLTVPVALFAAFLAVPWGGDQPTEVWALAKLRFFLKPRKRIWNQDGVTDLVTITAPKKIERQLTNNLSEYEVNSRLSALANTLDSRGWAVKNVNVNLTTQNTPVYVSSDRLVDVSSNHTVDAPVVDIHPADDILDEVSNPVAQNFTAMIDKAASDYKKALIDRMNSPSPQAYTPQNITTTPVGDQSLTVTPTQTDTANPAANWFMPHTTTDDSAQPPTDQSQPIIAVDTGVPQAAEPTAEELAILERSQQINAIREDATYGNMRVIKTPDQIEADRAAQAAAEAERVKFEQQAAQAEAARQAQIAAEKAQAAMNIEKQAAIINLSRRDDINISTLAREAEEVVISLH